jgi:hypothetical protein
VYEAPSKIHKLTGVTIEPYRTEWLLTQSKISNHYLKFLYRAHKSQLLVRIVSQTNPVPFYSFKIHFNIIPIYAFQVVLILQVSPSKIYALLIYSVPATYVTYLNVLPLIILIIYGERHHASLSLHHAA